VIEAKIILDSTNPHNDIRLITSELTYPRFIHAEFMTHRMFSRNAASSRAIPVRKMIKKVVNTPAMPVSWGKNRPGMSAEDILDSTVASKAQTEWLQARDNAAFSAGQMRKLGLHKQIANRIIEPWKNITVIVSATEFSNFFALRGHEDAQPEIQELSRAWREAIDGSVPQERAWHIPYIQDDEQSLDLELKKKIGVARCARVSYLTHDGKRDIEKDLVLHERLLTGSGHGHWSPFEHVAKATAINETRYNFSTGKDEFGPIWCGNFRGWIQYRKIHKGETQ
jgi:thymidylate synthase ThyX